MLWLKSSIPRDLIKCSSLQCPNAPQIKRVFMAFQGYSGSCSAILILQRGSPSTCTLNIKECDFRDFKTWLLIYTYVLQTWSLGNTDGQRSCVKYFKTIKKYKEMEPTFYRKQPQFLIDLMQFKLKLPRKLYIYIYLHMHINSNTNNCYEKY